MSISTTEANNFTPVHTLVSTPVTIVLTGGLIVIVLTGFFSFFYCGSFLQKLLTTWNHHRNRNRPSNLIEPSTPPENTGLNSKIIQSFPEFPYSVKDRGMDQCSICLLDFMDDDTMRLISTCNHFFHTICIDLWFESHKTCPVCRRELDVDQLEKPPNNVPEIDLVRSESHEEPLSSRDTLTIIVHEEHPTTTAIGSLDQTDEIESYERRMKESNLRFWRSHSTGHSIVVKTENDQEAAEEGEKEEFKIHIEISGECQFEDHKRTLPNRNMYCVRGTYSVG